jgi:hypothetical protein
MFGKGKFLLEAVLWEGLGLISRGNCLFRFLFFMFLVCAPLQAIAIESEAIPYLLPDEHELKPLLDSIFTRSRATLNCQSLKEAGFISCRQRKYTHIIVTTHPNVPGYVFKLFLDSQIRHKKSSEAKNWLNRAKGAERIAKIIKDNGYQSLFKVPRKWIYVLPEHPKLADGYVGRETLLVEEDMQILPNGENLQKWKSSDVSHEQLRGLYVIIRDAGLSDCLKPANIPFSVDGKVSFVDTEQFGESNIRYKQLKKYLSVENQAFWVELTN